MSEARNEGSLRRLVLLAFAKWDPCIYMGAILCDECPRKDCGDGDTCDMYHGRTGRQKSFEAGWDHKQNMLVRRGTPSPQVAGSADCYRDGTPRDSVCYCGMQRGPKTENNTCSQCGYVFPQNTVLTSADEGGVS